jgi:hypothetical protein
MNSDHSSGYVPKLSQPGEFRGVDDEAGKFTRCFDLAVNRLGEFCDVFFVQRGLGMHEKGGMRGSQGWIRS